MYTDTWGGGTEGKTPVGRARRRWEDNIETDFRKWDLRVWTGLIHLLNIHFNIIPI